MKPENCFSPADILLPNTKNLKLWSVVACDQYTSEPEYWETAHTAAGDQPSTLHMVFPEVYLGASDASGRIKKINATMQSYLDEALFTCHPDCFIYLERTLADGKVRRGLMGKIDLEAYDYTADSESLVRPTEGTVESRLPPRIQVREQATLELPHIMVLIDDAAHSVITPLADQTQDMPLLYSTELMANGGAVKGWLIDGNLKTQVQNALSALAPTAASGKKPLLYAVGDGNHSLATAKACYEKLKQQLPQEQWVNHPARYALVELVNLHDPAMEFEPIHRVLFQVNPEHVLQQLAQYYHLNQGTGQTITCVRNGKYSELTISNPSSQIAVGSLQNFIDDYIAHFGGEVDYIHGEEVAVSLSMSDDAISFLLPVMNKATLFPTVLLDGALPRKTFSMGHAHDKRFYLECRKIR